MRVATWNVHRGRGAFAPFRPDRILTVLAEIRPDLIALQEAQHYLRPGRGMLDAAALAHDLGLHPVPVTGRAGEQGFRSNVLLVRAGARLLRPAVPLRLGGLEPRGGIMADLDLGDGPFRVVGTHLSLGPRTRVRQAETILEAIRAAPALPALLLGDLNEWRPHASALGILAGHFGEAPEGEGTPPTFPTFRPRLALDRIMGCPRGMVSGLVAHDTPAARRASDHLPLVAEVRVAP